MCGLTGFYQPHGFNKMDGHETVATMADQIIHRGPDDSGTWLDQSAGIALAHRRLSILDLSTAGHQPMVSKSARFILAFNGEIYNHLDIRKEIESSGNPLVWKGHSDTETLLAGVEVWGIEETIKKSIGMFAIALWDRKTRTLILARDRIGEKPLYYGWQGQGNDRVFLFGSELKALKAHPAFKADVDRDALCLFLRYNYIPAPYSIYQGIAKLEPGCLLSISLAQSEPKVCKYWNAASVSIAGATKPFEGSADSAVDALETLTKDAVRQQMMADVPLGAFLSGGIDSSTVVALMQAQSSRPIKTFTIGCSEKGYNEAVHAKEVARYIGTEHTELYITPQQAMDVIPQLPSLYCEPFSDGSQIPTFLVSQLAKQHVTVSLSGDGGDELFCGYNRYKHTAALWRKLSCIPIPLRNLLAKGVTKIPPHTWDRYAGVLPWSHVGDKLHKGAGVMSSSSVEDLYTAMVSHWADPSALVKGGVEPLSLPMSIQSALFGLGDVQRMMAMDILTYLPDDILVKVDRAAMGVSLESRVPFLDHRLVEFAASLPMEYKLRDGQTKWVLRQLLYRYVPRKLIERPKMGFGFPLDAWLRGPLRDWAEGLLSEQRLNNDGFFHPDAIRKKWIEHLSKKRNWSNQLWSILMFQAWLEQEGK